MIRQAHTYLAGAMGGATLIAIAIAVFVMLVSAQVFRDWPIAALGGGGESAEVSDAQSPGATEPGAGAGAAGAQAGSAIAANDGGSARADLRDNAGSIAAGEESVTGGGNPTEPGSAGGAGGQGGGAGGDPQTTPASGNTGGSSGSGGGSAGGGGKTRGGPASSPSSQVTGTVNDTVNQVDEAALGGTLGESGVTETTEGVVNGVAGPESAAGKVVDEAAGAVGGILGGDR